MPLSCEGKYDICSIVRIISHALVFRPRNGEAIGEAESGPQRETGKSIELQGHYSSVYLASLFGRCFVTTSEAFPSIILLGSISVSHHTGCSEDVWGCTGHLAFSTTTINSKFISSS